MWYDSVTVAPQRGSRKESKQASIHVRFEREDQRSNQSPKCFFISRVSLVYDVNTRTLNKVCYAKVHPSSFPKTSTPWLYKQAHQRHPPFSPSCRYLIWDHIPCAPTSPKGKAVYKSHNQTEVYVPYRQ